MDEKSDLLELNQALLKVENILAGMKNTGTLHTLDDRMRKRTDDVPLVEYLTTILVPIEYECENRINELIKEE